uniref:Uncharacterized protein n=1 Tax=Syphacia muris TaxID=451379 RepID=A0A0N5AT44_9BILA
MCKRSCNRTQTNSDLENSRGRATATIAHSSVAQPGAYPVYGYDNLPYPYPVVNHQNTPNELPEALSTQLFPTGVPQSMLGHCVTSTSFLPPPPPYSQHDRYPPVEIPNASRTQLLRNFAKLTSDIPPVE